MTVEPFLGTRAQRGFMGTILLQAILVIAMVGLVFGWVGPQLDFHHSNMRTISCYLALFILAEIFEIVMGLDALRARNIIQIFGILVFHLALIVFSAIQVHETRQALRKENCQNCTGALYQIYQEVQPPIIVAPCVIGVAWASMIWWGRKLYEEFGWAILHVVKGNPTRKRMYRYYQIIICLLKVDFFCFTGVTIQLLTVVLDIRSAEFGVTIAAIPVVLILLACAGLAVQREIKWLMSISLFLMLAAETYCKCFIILLASLTHADIYHFPVVYKLVRFYLPQSGYRYIATRATLTTFTIFAFLILLGTFLVGLRCFADFDKGLLPSKMHDVNAQQRYSSVPTEMASPTSEEMGGVSMSPWITIE